MFKHLYYKPKAQVITVKPEGIICFSSAHEATEAGGGQLTGGSLPIVEDTSTDEDPWDDENQGAKKSYYGIE